MTEEFDAEFEKLLDIAIMRHVKEAKWTVSDDPGRKRDFVDLVRLTDSLLSVLNTCNAPDSLGICALLRVLISRFIKKGVSRECVMELVHNWYNVIKKETKGIE